MKELSIIKIELLDQYEKFQRCIMLYKQEIDQCVKGYLSEKKIRGKSYYYLQWKTSGRLCSKYIDPEYLEVIKQNITRRKRLEERVKDMEQAVGEIENFVGKDVVNEYINRRQ